MEKSIPKTVIFDFFEGKATSIQRKLIEEWLLEPQNEIIFYQLLDEWESTHPQYLPNTEKAIEKYLSVLQTSDFSETTVDSKIEVDNQELPHWWRLWSWRIAASVILLIGVSLFLFRHQVMYQTYQTGYAQTKSFRLEDGTMVTLNANSKLAVPRWNMNNTKREVLLEGEGEFKVTHTLDHKRFLVKTGDDFEVEVLGTEFVMYARAKGKKVVLNKGKVQVNYRARKQLTMKPGDVVTLPQGSEKIRLTQTLKPQLHSSWKEHQFYFDETPLSEVADMLNEHFGLVVVFGDSTLANRRLAGYFKATNSEEVIEVLSVLLDVTVEKKGQTVIIKSNR
jgi:transmembrane sensor